mmetsp:Transcript_16427/g.20515  ORF Transcript_16427/g.20515 Transcript_16427/m.20515 type:complete len:447 (+) Transcript_16427:226-1566(+)|eukprot:CAMPEP_0172499308 /NCGR_PEP_ID=MMETSP1066-20121228/125361_1 /TAXON_ID=671091 /ORGANISM="Coscinodiscus wailesii, Strain CCMP2513" /LENGTH=446 /DNA_ID=CAMNT_0013272973 /DNA_START=216 /DNA_END=1556 /DNA_ORIENTATION=-
MTEIRLAPAARQQQCDGTIIVKCKRSSLKKSLLRFPSRNKKLQKLKSHVSELQLRLQTAKEELRKAQHDSEVLNDGVRNLRDSTEELLSDHSVKADDYMQLVVQEQAAREKEKTAMQIALLKLEQEYELKCASILGQTEAQIIAVQQKAMRELESAGRIEVEEKESGNEILEIVADREETSDACANRGHILKKMKSLTLKGSKKKLLGSRYKKVEVLADTQVGEEISNSVSAIGEDEASRKVVEGMTVGTSEEKERTVVKDEMSCDNASKSSVEGHVENYVEATGEIANKCFNISLDADTTADNIAGSRESFNASAENEQRERKLVKQLNTSRSDFLKGSNNERTVFAFMLMPQFVKSVVKTTGIAQLDDDTAAEEDDTPNVKALLDMRSRSDCPSKEEATGKGSTHTILKRARELSIFSETLSSSTRCCSPTKKPKFANEIHPDD